MSGEYRYTEDAKVKAPSMFYYTKTVHHEAYDRISPSRPELSAEAKNVVVTGGGTGIGKAIAVAFTQAGAKSVSILGRREDRLKTAVEELKTFATNAVTAIQYQVVDLMKRDDTEGALQAISEKVGKLDILISNAAGLPSLEPLAECSVVDFMRGFDYNVLTAFNAVQAFLQFATGSPMIFSISAALAHMAPVPNAGVYSVSKAANLKMMDYIAAENPHVHVVNIQPGTVVTEMSSKVGIIGPDNANLPGAFCVWLASREAEFLKSKYVWAHWDVDELMAKRDEIEQSRLFTWLLDGVPM